jgi:tetrapyrrole methylase family protein/MazG family protein
MNNFDKLKAAVDALRGENGCPWDKAQTLYSMKDDFIEEAYELVEALDKDDTPNICEELGDVLLHVLLHARIASEDGKFSIDDVMEGINTKLIRRHPHVFANENITESDAVLKRWEEIKAEEKKSVNKHYLDKANKALPALLKAHKLQHAAAKVGFDWAGPGDVLLKADEEMEELCVAAAEGDTAHIKEELGDLLFVLVNLARHYGFTADEALRGANEKFVTRFNYIEESLTNKGRSLESASLDEMESLWQQA